MNLPEDNIDTINKNAGILIDASREVGLKINVEKTKHMLLFRDQNAGQDQNIKTGRLKMWHRPNILYNGNKSGSN
jgi:hypothetical protein